jgi:two-component system chemotaxis sensor kinase CheA
MVHTLKGNAGIFGLTSIATMCHEIENRMAETQQPPSAAECVGLASRWTEIEDTLDHLLGDQRNQRIELSDKQYQDVLRAALSGVTGRELARVIAEWKLESTAVRLRRLGMQAEGLAARLNKGVLDIQIQDNNVRLKAESWSSFWGALIHVIRNCIDHGIEPESERIQAGKPEHGHFSLATKIANDQLIVEVSDDGRGIDWDAVRRKAKEMGVPCATQSDLVAALSVDGLSTRERSNEYSGRGVGMSAVKAECEKRGGKIEVVSQSGHGTLFRFIFPRPRRSHPPVAA